MKFKITILLFVSMLNAQNESAILSETQWLNGWTNFKPKNAIYKEPNIILSGNITTNLKLLRKNVYRLTGIVRVTNKAVLTIEPGTVILGDAENSGVLIIAKGSKIIAEGTQTEPIIFTSSKKADERKAGDWGGIIILGNASTNKVANVSQLELDDEFVQDTYGGNVADDNSGVLKYVRIEFAGSKISRKNPLNALTIAGVGSKTKFENIQVSFSNDDAFQIHGGNVNMNKMLTFKTKGDDFDISHGSQCKVTNSIVLRSPYVFDVLRSRAFEIKNHNEKEGFNSSKNETNVTIDNLAILTTEENKTDAMKEAIFLNENANLYINNTIVSGYKSVIAFDNYFFKEDKFKKVKMSKVTAEKCQNLFSDVNYKGGYDIEESLKVINDKFASNCYISDENTVYKSLILRSIDSKSSLVDFR